MRRAILALSLAAGCSSSNDTLTCAWLEGNNCWKQLLTTIEPCLPADAPVGVVNADHSRCVSADGGTAVTFDLPLVLPPPADGLVTDWEFTLQNAGATCLRLQTNTDGLTLQAAAGRIVVSHLLGGVQVACADGTSAQTRDPSTIASCPNPDGGSRPVRIGLGIGANYFVSSTETSVDVGLLRLRRAFRGSSSAGFPKSAGGRAVAHSHREANSIFARAL